MILKLTIYGFYIVKRIQIKWKDLKFIHKIYCAKQVVKVMILTVFWKLKYVINNYMFSGV